MGGERRIRFASGGAGARRTLALLLAGGSVLLASGCGGSTAKAAAAGAPSGSTRPTTSASAAVPQAGTTTATATPSAPATGPASTPPAAPPVAAAGGAGAASPTAAVQAWVAAVVEKQDTAACALMLEPASGGALRPVSAAECAQGATALDGLRTAWLKGSTPLPPKVSVTGFSSSTATAATVSDTGVLLDGRSLHALEAIGATVPSGGSFSVSLDLSKHLGGWYVSDMSIGASTGTQTGSASIG